MFALQPFRFALGGVVAAAALAFGTQPVRAHCDTLGGPVVTAARRALAQTNVNLVLIWVQKADEAEIRKAFERTLAVRNLNAEARDLADRYFFETLVRIHRAGEGAPYTGLREADTDSGPAIPAADRAVEDGKLEPVATLLSAAMHEGLHREFAEVQARKRYAKDDVEAGRTFVKAYVEFVHYVEGVHAVATGVHVEPEPEQAPGAGRERH